MSATWKGESVAQRSEEELSSSAADRTAGGEDLGGFFEVRVQRVNGVAGEVDELGVAEDVAEHRFGALVVGVQLVEGSLEPRVGSRIARHESRSGQGLAVK